MPTRGRITGRKEQIMTSELKENIQNLVSYYNHHGVAEMMNKHPGFVADDFAELLVKLHKEIEAQNA